MPHYSDFTDLPVVDSHVHVFPERIFQAVKRWFAANAWGFHVDGTAEDLIRLQFEHGAAGLVLMAYAHRPGLSEYLNGFVSELVRRFTHTAGLATLHPQDADKKSIVRRALEEEGLKGLKLHCHVQQVAPDDKSLWPAYEALAEADGILVIHAGKEPAIDAYGLDVRSVTGADMTKSLLEMFPELRIVVPHLGIDETSRFFELLDEHPNLFLDTAMVIGRYFPVEPDPEALARYSDRILYGSDYPHIPYHLTREVEVLTGLGLDREDLRRILYRNAADLFHIDLLQG